MHRDDFSLGPGRVLFWDLRHVDRDRPLSSQRDHLKEDLAQVEYPSGRLLDVGWYPEFSETGAFSVKVIANGDWTQPLFERRCADVDSLVAAVAEAARSAATTQ